MPEENIESTSPEHSGFPSFEKILVAYDGTELSKRAVSYAAYFSKLSNSEIFVINVVKSETDFNGLPLTIKANGQEKEEQAQQPAARESQSTVLKEIVREMTTTCKAAGLTKKIIFEIRA